MRDWGWVVDRWIEEWQCWAPVAVLGPGIRQDLIEYLKANDLQRIGPEKRLQEKRHAAGKVRAENERLANERVLEAIDGLSARQIKEFIQVEKAVQTGETAMDLRIAAGTPSSSGRSLRGTRRTLPLR